MEQKPTISVIVPFYNVEQQLFFNCIKSILAQTYRNFELIIVNDGSSKKFNDMLKSVACMDSRIRVLDKENGGVSAARNMGVEASKGDYVAFIDADDILKAEYLKQALEIVEIEDADYIIGAVRMINPSEAGKTISYVTNLVGNNHYLTYEKRNFDKLIPCLVASNRMIHFDNGGYIGRGPVARLLKVAIARKVSFPVGIEIGEDVIWNQRVLKECSKVAVAENIWYYYLQNSSSAVHRYRENAIDIIQAEGMALFAEMDTSKDEIYMAFCSRFLSETRLVICRGCLTRRENKERFFSKYQKFMQLKRMEPWNFITGRYMRVGGIREKVIYFLFKSNLYFPIAYVKDRFGKSF